MHISPVFTDHPVVPKDHSLWGSEEVSTILSAKVLLSSRIGTWWNYSFLLSGAFGAMTGLAAEGRSSSELALGGLAAALVLLCGILSARAWVLAVLMISFGGIELFSLGLSQGVIASVPFVAVAITYVSLRGLDARGAEFDPAELLPKLKNMLLMLLKIGLSGVIGSAAASELVSRSARLGSPVFSEEDR
jgi:hypothetical protein